MPVKKKVKNDYQEYEKIKDLKIINTPIIHVPKEMVFINKEGLNQNIYQKMHLKQGMNVVSPMC